jgi:hypothetical protein
MTFWLNVRLWLRDFLDIPPEAERSQWWDILAGATAGLFVGMAFPFFIRLAKEDLHASDAAITVFQPPTHRSRTWRTWRRSLE